MKLCTRLVCDNVEKINVDVSYKRRWQYAMVRGSFEAWTEEPVSELLVVA